jgi:hypothetical protein
MGLRHLFLKHRGTEDTEGSRSRDVHDIAGATTINQVVVVVFFTKNLCSGYPKSRCRELYDSMIPLCPFAPLGAGPLCLCGKTLGVLLPGANAEAIPQPPALAAKAAARHNVASPSTAAVPTAAVPTAAVPTALQQGRPETQSRVLAQLRGESGGEPAVLTLRVVP